MSVRSECQTNKLGVRADAKGAFSFWESTQRDLEGLCSLLELLSSTTELIDCFGDLVSDLREILDELDHLDLQGVIWVRALFNRSLSLLGLGVLFGAFGLEPLGPGCFKREQVVERLRELIVLLS